MLEKGVRLSKHAPSLALFIGHYSDVGGPRYFVPHFLVSPLKFVFFFLPFSFSFLFLFLFFKEQDDTTNTGIYEDNKQRELGYFAFSEKMIYSLGSKSKFLK